MGEAQQTLPSQAWKGYVPQNAGGRRAEAWDQNVQRLRRVPWAAAGAQVVEEELGEAATANEGRPGKSVSLQSAWELRTPAGRQGRSWPPGPSVAFRKGSPGY